MRVKVTERFTGRVDDYARYRPRYPAALVDAIADATGLSGTWTVADLGAGTGISAEPFIARGHHVIAVEPNAEMRAALHAQLGDQPRLRIVEGTAEATGLPAQSVELVIAAQAFHWFDVPAARRECARILKPHGAAAVIWNTRDNHASPFMRAYEAFLLEHGTDYASVRHDRHDDRRITDFFARYASVTLPNEQRLDAAGLAGRVLSSSYTPPAGDPRREPLLAALARLFEEHARAGQVTLVYRTELYVGRP